MCGIVAYIGNRDAYPILIKGLQRLEYRGYDSAGVALINKSGDLNVSNETEKNKNRKLLLTEHPTNTILNTPNNKLQNSSYSSGLVYVS